MDKNCYNQTDFGKIAGVHQSYLSRMQSGYYKDIKLSTLLQLANALKKDVSYFLP